MYGKEAEKQQEHVEKMKAEGKDEYDIRKQVSCWVVYGNSFRLRITYLYWKFKKQSVLKYQKMLQILDVYVN